MSVVVTSIARLTLMCALIATSGASLANSPPDARGEARLAQILAGRVAGPPVDCIDLHLIDSTEIVDGTAIVYRDGARIYVNRPTGRQQLRNDETLVTHTWSSQLCRVDTIRLIDRSSGFVRGFVGLGPFVPYSRPKRG